MTTSGEESYFSRIIPEEKPEEWNEVPVSAICSFQNGKTLPADERRDGSVPVYGSGSIVDHHDEAITDSPVIIIGRKGSAGEISYSEEPVFVIDTAYFIDSNSTNYNLRWLYYLLKSLDLDQQSEHSAIPGINQNLISEHIVFLPPFETQANIATYLDSHITRINQLIKKKESLIELLKEEREAAISRAVMKGLDPDVEMIDSGVEWVGNVPAHWENLRISSLIEEVKRPVDVREDEIYQEIGIRSHGRGIFHKDPVTGDEIGSKNVFEVVEGALIFNIVFAWEGAVAVSTEEESGMIASHRFPMYVPRDEEIDLRYLKYFFTHGYGQGILEWNSPGAAGRNRTLNREATLSEEFWFPPNDEQQRIARYISKTLSRIDDLVYKIQEEIELLQEKRKALITAAVTGKTDISPSGEEKEIETSQ
jgi:type I restriction enzyme S subunit